MKKPQRKLAKCWAVVAKNGRVMGLGITRREAEGECLRGEKIVRMVEVQRKKRRAKR